MMIVSKDYYSKDTIKSVYGVAVIMMVLHHLFDDTALITQTILPNSAFLEEKISFLAKLCVAIYSLLAGTGVGRIKSGSCKEICVVLINRIRNLYFKYWFIFFICIPVGFTMGVYSFDGSEFLMNFLGLSSSYNGTWWFIYQYIAMLLFAPMIVLTINQLSGEKNLIKIISTSLVTILGWICVLKIGIYVETVYFVIFILGIIIEKFKVFEYLEKKVFPVIGAKEIIISVLCLGTILVLRLVIAHLTPFWFQMDILFALAFVFFLKPMLSINVVRRTFSIYGLHSTSIWFSHAFISDYYFSRILFSVGNSILLIVIMLGVSLILGILLDTAYDVVLLKR